MTEAAVVSTTQNRENLLAAGMMYERLGKSREILYPVYIVAVK
jgi:hypothetical protein